MIGIRLTGGIGEQLFQYATARALSLRLKTNLCYDLSKLEKNPNWLEKFETIPQPQLKNIQLQLAIEAEDRFNSKVLSLDDNVLLDGKFQFEKYFEDQQEYIRTELVIKDPISEECLNWDSKIRQEKFSVSIHVSKSSMDSLKKYYEYCVDFLKSNFSNLTLYIFSDDVSRCVQTFRFNAPTFFIDMHENEHEEIYLASLCRYHIISDEIKSFWHAWLDRRKSSLVFVPEKYLESFSEAGNIDRIPDRWMIIKS